MIGGGPEGFGCVSVWLLSVSDQVGIASICWCQMCIAFATVVSRSRKKRIDRGTLFFVFAGEGPHWRRVFGS